MSLSRYINRLRRLDAMIRLKSTGTPGELAGKLEISERWLYILLEELREEMDCPIRYDRNRRSYYYAKAGRIHIGFQAELDTSELKHVNGGMVSGKLCSSYSQIPQLSELAQLEATIVAGGSKESYPVGYYAREGVEALGRSIQAFADFHLAPYPW